jgi:FkbM family methyltransferase
MLATLSRMLGSHRPSLKDGYQLSATCQIPGLADIYHEHLGLRGDGTFVEVGAFDGEYVSNTSGLADAGWRGFYLEPVPDHAEKCRQRHRRNRNVRVFQLAIGEKEGVATLHVGGPLTTADPKMLELFNGLEWAKGFHRGQTVQAQQVTLDSFLRRQALPSSFDLLSIDVEGFEWQVLQGFTLERWLPRMVIIELHDENETYAAFHDKCKAIAQRFDACGYRPVFKDKSNTVYVRNTQE